jgi:hypothetical protein
MGREGDYSQGKRQREQQQARKQQEKDQRRQMRREQGSSGPEFVSAQEVVGRLPSIDDAMRAIEQGSTTKREVASIPCRMFVGGLGTAISEPELREAFSQFGVVVDAAILMDRGTGQSRGFGFVTLANRKDAARAIEALDGSELNGRRIAVSVATDRPR